MRKKPKQARKSGPLRRGEVNGEQWDPASQEVENVARLPWRRVPGLLHALRQKIVQR